MKKKRKLSAAQKKAHERNWNKGLITCSIKHFETLQKSAGISFHEKMKIIMAKKLLKEILDDWKPVL